MKVFGIAGYKNAGKTTLVVDLIGEFRARGLRVATVKHAHHEFDIDHPGKDSHQHRQAGASEVIIASSRRWAHICELTARDEPPLVELLGRLGDVDLVLVEGYKHGNHPKLELRRKGVDAPRMAGTDTSVLGVICDDDTDAAGLPLLMRDDLAGIADFIEANAEGV